MHALKGVASAQDIESIKRASRSFDFATQLPGNAYLHSMREVWQDEATATRQRNHFVTARLQEARQLEIAGDHAAALEAFGEGTHPEMDRTSPSHANPNGSPAEFRFWSITGIRAHVSLEARRPTSEEMQQSDRFMQKAYKFVFGGR